jgi:TonB family protein
LPGFPERPHRRSQGKLPVCLVFPKDRIEGVKANWQFALPFSEAPFMRKSHIARILLNCVFSLIVGAPYSVFAQQFPQANEKERGIELYRKGDFNEAVKSLREAVKKQRSDSDAWYYLGLSSHRAGKIKDARKAFEKTISLRSDFAPAYAAMAYMHLLGNDNKGALKNAEKAFALDPKNYESLYIAGEIRLRENAAAEALAKADEALKIKSDYPEALILKTRALISMFAQARIKMHREAESWTTGDQPDDPAREEGKRAKYSLLKQASESLEAYLKLRPETSQQPLWGEQLEALRVYGRLGTMPGSDISLKLRPEILYREKAKYTDAARNAGIQGTVILMVVFADDGVIKHIVVIQGLSHGLTEQAISATRKIRFNPAVIDGKPVCLIGSLEFTFNLY